MQEEQQKVLEYFLPPSGVRFLDQIRPYGPMILLGIIFVLPMIGIDIFGIIISPLLRLISRLLLGVPI